MAKRAAKKQAESKRVKVTLVKSTIGFGKKQAAIVRGSGLRRLEPHRRGRGHADVRGMIHKVRHL